MGCEEIIKNFWDPVKESKDLDDISHIEQGSLISLSQTEDIGIFFPTIEGETSRLIGAMVSNHTCDIVKSTTTHLYITPVFELEAFILPLIEGAIKSENEKREEKLELRPKNFIECSKRIKEQLRKKVRDLLQFKDIAKFLTCPLKKDEYNINLGWGYVDLNYIHSVKKEKFLDKFKEYIRFSLKSPYKEKYSYMLAGRIHDIATDNLDEYYLEIIEQMGKEK